MEKQINQGSILVIDDELVMCELLRDLLSDRGYTVSHALSGEEGVKAFKKGSFNLVITDLKLPDLSGIQVLEAIRGDDPDAVIIVMTGYPSF
ncbi:MAG: response regulator, partial [Candidatus Omnitrophota bacterium]